MTGPAEGVIGANPKAIFRRAKYGFPAKIEPHEDEKGEGQFNGVIIEFDDDSNKVISIRRINERYSNKNKKIPSFTN
jgi:calcineurin-like phosphoesterase